MNSSSHLATRRPSPSAGSQASSPSAPHVAFPPDKNVQPHVPSSASATEPSGSSEQDAPVILEARSVTKGYRRGKHVVEVLRGVDFAVTEASFTAIIGQSGSGKSTLLHLLGTLDKPDEGETWFEGHRIDNLPRESHDVLRNKYFGMIFQFYHLLPELTALENVLTPLMVQHGVWSYWWKRRELVERARHLLDLVGLSHREKHRPRELSGGEMQRTAIARALIAEPKLLLADEPTGNLDSQAGDEILEILRSLNKQANLTIVMVTHDQGIADQADRIVRLAEGLVQTA